MISWGPVIRGIFPRRLLLYVVALLCPVLLALGAAFYLAGWVGVAAVAGLYLVAGVGVRYFMVDLGSRVVWTSRGSFAASAFDAARHLEGTTTPELARSMNHARRLLSLFVVCLWPLYVIVWRSASRS